MEEHFDVVIVGAGLGGLLSAVFLAKEGKKVIIIEQNKQLGGCLQTFSFDKKLFDSCVHYIGALEEGQTQRKIFQYAGIMEDLALEQLSMNGFDEITFGDKMPVYPHAQGSKNFIEQLLPFFPGEKENLQKYWNLLQYTVDHFPLYKLEIGDNTKKYKVTNWELQRTVASLTANKRLQSVLTGNNILYAGQRDSTPFYLHALVLKSYIDSAYKFKNGSSQITKLLTGQLRRFGGMILKKEKVNQVRTNDGIINKIITASGKEILGKQFIANISPSALLSLMDRPIFKPAFQRRIMSTRNTISSFMVNMVLKPKTIPYPNHNVYWNRSADVYQGIQYQQNNWPENYALYFSRDHDNPEFAESVSILTYMHYEEFGQWANSYNNSAHPSNRPPAYLDKKMQKAEQLMWVVSRRFPDLIRNCQSFRVASPLTFRDYTGTEDGNMYGIAKNLNDPKQTAITVASKIPNLFFTGQNAGIHGVLGVSITAIATCGHILGLEHLVHKIGRET
ncbi:MAG TPA: NAD(P)/FAD-dependent oxidoreductase [Edaphocola sp.]|nr:NAD(P)/FAD-dependent oxidoreductase [Edaphocola sp.]